MKCSPKDVQKCLWASSVFMQRLFFKSHTRNVLSSLADTRNLPPGWKTTPRTQLSCAINTNNATPAPTSHILKETNEIGKCESQKLSILIFLLFSLNYYLPDSFIARSRSQKRSCPRTLLIIYTGSFVYRGGCAIWRPSNAFYDVIVCSQFGATFFRRYSPNSYGLIVRTTG